jgi:hypothetical protein
VQTLPEIKGAVDRLIDAVEPLATAVDAMSRSSMVIR